MSLYFINVCSGYIMSSIPHVPSIDILLLRQVQRFAKKLTDDKDQQKEILCLWNETITRPKEDHSIPSSKKKISNLIEKAGIIAIKTLSGYMIDPATKLAFDSDKLVIGKEVKGKIQPLTEDDINFCEKQMIRMKPKA